MRLEKPRVEPLTDEQLAPELKVQLGGRVLNIFRTLAHHPKLMKRWLVFGNHILSKSTLSPRDREIAILRAGFLSKSGYEWGQHVVIGKAAGLSDEELEGIKSGDSANCWSESEKLILKTADELHEDVFITDDTWMGLEKHYSTQQIMDMVFTCGQYRMLAGALNSFGVQLDDDLVGL